MLILFYYVQRNGDILYVLENFEIQYALFAFFIIVLHLFCLFILWEQIVTNIGKIKLEFKILFHSLTFVV